MWGQAICPIPACKSLYLITSVTGSPRLLDSMEVLAQGSFLENAWELKSALAPELTQVLLLQLCGTGHLGHEMGSQIGQCGTLTRDETVAKCIKVGSLNRRTGNRWPVEK